MNLLAKHALQALFLFACLPSGAQDVGDMWISMPSGMTPYLTANQKKEMVECARAGLDASVVNELQGTTKADTLSPSYGRFTLSASRRMDLIRLPRAGADSIFCVIDTRLAPAAESTVDFYDGSWRLLPRGDFMEETGFSTLTERPGEMDEGEYDRLREWFDPELAAVTYFPDGETFVITPSAPFSPTEDREKLEAIMCKRVLKWDGKKLTSVIN